MLGVISKRVEIDPNDGIQRIDERHRVSRRPPTAARAGMAMSEIFGVSFTITGILATSMTHRVICSQYSGTCPTALPMPRSLIPCGQP